MFRDLRSYLQTCVSAEIKISLTRAVSKHAGAKGDNYLHTGVQLLCSKFESALFQQLVSSISILCLLS